MARSNRQTPSAGSAVVQQLARDMVSAWRTQALYAAVVLGIPEQLKSGAATAETLAVAVNADTDGLRRLLEALCTLGVCRLRTGGAFSLTRTGQLLCEADGTKLSLRNLVEWWGGPLWSMWGDLVWSVRTGKSVRQKQTGLSNYQFLTQAPDTARIFHAAMREMTALVAPAIAALPAWQHLRTMVDVGGGSGQLAAAILSAHPQLVGTVILKKAVERTVSSI